jgi:hypothetical protein
MIYSDDKKLYMQLNVACRSFILYVYLFMFVAMVRNATIVPTHHAMRIIFLVNGHYRKTTSFRRPKPSEMSPEPSEVVTSDGLRRVPSEVTP